MTPGPDIPPVELNGGDYATYKSLGVSGGAKSDDGIAPYTPEEDGNYEADVFAAEGETGSADLNVSLFDDVVEGGDSEALKANLARMKAAAGEHAAPLLKEEKPPKEKPKPADAPAAAATADPHETAKAQLPEFTVPSFMQQTWKDVADDGTVMKWELEWLKEEAGSNAAAQKFVDDLTKAGSQGVATVRAKTSQGTSIVTVYPHEQAGPWDVHDAIPKLAKGATKTLDITDLHEFLLDDATIASLEDAAKRGVKVSVTLRQTGYDSGSSFDKVERLIQAGVNVTLQPIFFSEPRGYKIVIPRIQVDGKPQTVQ